MCTLGTEGRRPMTASGRSAVLREGASPGRCIRLSAVVAGLLVIAATVPLAQDRPVELGDLQCLTPKWSPDGTKIAFAGRVGGEASIYLADADGGNLTRLTDDPGDQTQPCWSPDGGRIAFAWRRDGNAQIFTIALDGKRVAELTDKPGSDAWPAWSPDGRRIAFVSDRSGNDDIYVVGADGGEPARLTDDPASDTTPRWSPDGTRIAFASQRDGLYQLFLMNADGSDQGKAGPGYAKAPSWSPDGTRIAYSGSAVAQGGLAPVPTSICLVTVESQEVLRPPSGSMGAAPDWSPDGARIVFARNFGLYLMNADGSDLHPLGRR
jgi:Tol biopolymer transport system component